MVKIHLFRWYKLRIAHCICLILGFFVLFCVSFLCCSTNDLSFKPYSSEQLRPWEPPVFESNPSDWWGENGEAVVIGKEDEIINSEKFKVNEFNIIASDQIALNRSLKDIRLEECKSKEYSELLPSTSIIIVFHNEAWSTLLRTVHSIIKTSPLSLIEEIILVDDASTKVYLKRQLEDYVLRFPVPIKIMRLGLRSGLIKARLLGAAHSKGQVLTFLDAHCECMEGWLEPLLDRIVQDRTRVVCPIIDVIDDVTFQYIPASTSTWGGFDWKIGFRWYSAPKREHERRKGDQSLPLKTPTMSGGLFAIDRDYFEHLGKYDEGMVIWGAENLEFSFRIWMCGGSVEIVTCSRVGHIFRKVTPYTMPGGKDFIVWHNTARLAKVWLDEWQEFYFTFYKSAKSLVSEESLAERRKLRKEKCGKSFEWYLENIIPESQLPRDYYRLGSIETADDTKFCVDSLWNKRDFVEFRKCYHHMGHEKPMSQLFLYNKKEKILNDENCLQANHQGDLVRLKRCTENRNQYWTVDEEKAQIIHKETGLCMEKALADNRTRLVAIIRECDTKNKDQKLKILDNFNWHSPSHRKELETIAI